MVTTQWRCGPGHPDAEEGPGHARGPQGRPVERPLSADRFGLQRAAPRDGKTWRSSRPRSSGSSKTTPTSSSATRPPHQGGGALYAKFPVQSSRNQSRVLGLGGARKSSSCLTAAGLPRLVSRPAASPLPWGAGSASPSRVSRPSVLRTVMESTARSCCTSPY